MALFGDLGKALGLGSGKDILPIIGTAAGFYFGGPLGASIGSGIGSLAGGKSVNDALTNAALAYGVTSFVSPSMMRNPQATGAFGSNALQQSLYNLPTKVASTPVSVPQTSTFGDSLTSAQVEAAGKAVESSGGIFDSALDFMGDNKFLTASVASGLFGALGSLDEEEDDPNTLAQRSYPDGEAHSVIYQGVEYDLRDPDDKQAYKEAKAETQRPGFRYDTDEVFVRRAAHGGAIQGHPEAHGAMYRHDKMGYDVPVKGEVDGPGTGTSDSVPARLSDGEFVLTAKAVRGAGSGDRNVGAARLYDMMAELEATA
jgi:hypothetical protein